MKLFHEVERLEDRSMLKGIENIKESPGRLDAFKPLCESMGAKVEGFYLTMGRYDLVVIVEAPDQPYRKSFSQHHRRGP